MDDNMKEENNDGLERPLREELRRSASIPPSARLNRKILRRIRRQPVLKPFLAGGVAVAAMIAMVTWLTVLYAESGLSMEPIMAAVLTSLIYLAVCSVATLPLMMLPGRFGLATRTLKETP
jgi:hypothetical protein